MPKYDYACKACAAPFEVERGMNDATEGVECPRCHGRDVHRLYGQVGLATGHAAAPRELPMVASSEPSSAGGCCSGGMCSQPI